MSPSGTTVKRVSPSRTLKGWRPVSEPTPHGTILVWVYCPTYPFIKIGRINPSMLRYCPEATHWHMIVAGEGRPPAPKKGLTRGAQAR